MPSFDVVSRTDLMEVDNAIHGVEREIKQRFDLANTKCSVSRSDNTMTLIANNNMKMEQVVELLRMYLAKRKVELGALDFGTPQNAAGGALRETVSIKQGIDGDLVFNCISQSNIYEVCLDGQLSSSTRRARGARCAPP